MGYATEAVIVNEALVSLGEKPLAGSLDATTDPRAVMANTIYDNVRDEVLTLHDWAFASVVAELTVDAGYTDNFTEFDYVYDLPADNLRVINLVGYSASNPTYEDAPYTAYLIRDGHLFTSETPCWIRYIKQVTDVTTFPLMFGRALAYAVAYEIAQRLVEDQNKVQRAFQMYTSKLSEAMRIESLEKKARDVPSTLITDVG